MMNLEKLFKEAVDVSNNSYAKYSNFSVGASILLGDGTIISGTNIENASYGLTICAERSCLVSAYSKGYKIEDIKAMAIYANTKNYISPCGACRQVMSELIDAECPIYLLNKEKDYLKINNSDLLPFAFKEDDMHGN